MMVLVNISLLMNVFDDEVDYAVLMHEAKKYYANILMLYGRQAQTALNSFHT